MEYSLVPVLKIELTLPKETFDFIWEACKNHYSYDVSSLIEVGGFMYGWKGRGDFAIKQGKTFSSYTLTFRQLDTLCKAVEFPATEKGMEIISGFMKILKRINEKYQTLTEIVNQ